MKDKNNKTTSYVYDSANQLVRENNQAAGKTRVWAYDNAGNIENRKEYAYTTGTLGTVVDTIDYVYGDTNWGDFLKNTMELASTSYSIALETEVFRAILYERAYTAYLLDSKFAVLLTDFFQDSIHPQCIRTFC